MKNYPVILQKQIDDREDEDINWREIAKDKVFSDLENRISGMEESHQNILSVAPHVYGKALTFSIQILMPFDYLRRGRLWCGLVKPF